MCRRQQWAERGTNLGWEKERSHQSLLQEGDECFLRSKGAVALTASTKGRAVSVITYSG